MNGFESLDRQGVNVWALNTMKPGPQTFTWYHTAKHKTNNWRYYITKQDWDVNKPLSREAFEKSRSARLMAMPSRQKIAKCTSAWCRREPAIR